MIDVVHEINAVRRQVGTRILEPGEARTIKRIMDEALGACPSGCSCCPAAGQR